MRIFSLNHFARIVLCVCAAAALASAADLPVAGRWRTIDDKTEKPRSIVLIYEENGMLSGKVESSLNPATANRVCDKCKGERKGQPIVGMVILWNMKADGSGYSGGSILDPDSGSVYKCKLKLTDSGKRLEVRGYIGFSLLGRTQTWLREE